MVCVHDVVWEVPNNMMSCTGHILNINRAQFPWISNFTVSSVR